MRPEVAEDLAVEVDRLALCIHRPAGRRPELMSALVPLGLPPQSVVVVAARFLAAGRVTIDDLRSMSRYQRDSDTAATLEAHVRPGLLEPADDRAVEFTPIEGLRAGASMVLAIQAEEAERLWASSPRVESLKQQAQAHVGAALASPLVLDAFRRQVGAHHALPDSDAGQLLGCITELRYLRADVHSLCLADEGLLGPPARALHRLWRGFDAGEAAGSLVETGLAELVGGGVVITERGAATCERVEAATNVAFADLFRSIADDLSTGLLDGMRSLAGDDPRPPADR